MSFQGFHRNIRVLFLLLLLKDGFFCLFVFCFVLGGGGVYTILPLVSPSAFENLLFLSKICRTYDI